MLLVMAPSWFLWYVELQTKVREDLTITEKLGHFWRNLIDERLSESMLTKLPVLYDLCGSNLI